MTQKPINEFLLIEQYHSEVMKLFLPCVNMHVIWVFHL